MPDTLSIKSTSVAFIGLLLTAVVTISAVVYNYSAAYAALDAKVCKLEELSKDRARKLEEMQADMRSLTTSVAVMGADLKYARQTLDEIKDAVRATHGLSSKGGSKHGNLTE